MYTLVGYLMKSKQDIPTSKLSLTIKLLTFLYSQNGLVKADELAEKFFLTKRSIRRLISELRDLGYNIISVSGPYGGYKLDRSNIILPVRISNDYKQAFLAIENTIMGADLVNKEDSLRLLNIIGIQSQLKTPINTEVYSTKKLLKSKSDQIKKVSKVLTAAINNKQRVRIKYQSLSKPKSKLVWQEFRPERFQLFNQVMYIKGYYDNTSESFRTLRLSRFEDIELINKKYSFNENFEKDNNQSAFSNNVYKLYTVKLKILKGNHDLLDYKYGENQVIEEHKDYHILNFDLSGDLLIKELVLSMGKYCQIIEPKNIKKDIKTELEAMVLKYK